MSTSTHVQPTPSAIPIRSSLSQSQRGLPLQARTRSMSRLNLASLADKPNKLAQLSKTHSSRHSLSKQTNSLRRPLQNVDVRSNEMLLDNGKRKGELMDSKPAKVQKFDNPIILRPPTPPRPHVPLNIAIPQTPSTSQATLGTTPNRLRFSKLQTPTRQTPIRPALQPTPARELLRRKVADEEETSSVPGSPESPIIARPPTPPRKHIDLNPHSSTPLATDSQQHSILSTPVFKLELSTPIRQSISSSGQESFVLTPSTGKAAASNLRSEATDGAAQQDRTDLMADAKESVEESVELLMPGTSIAGRETSQDPVSVTTMSKPISAAETTTPETSPKTEMSWLSSVTVTRNSDYTSTGVSVLVSSGNDEGVKPETIMIDPSDRLSGEETPSALDTEITPDEAMEVDTIDSVVTETANPSKTKSTMAPPSRIPAPSTLTRPRTLQASSNPLNPPVAAGPSTLKRSAPSMSALPTTRRGPSTRPTNGLKSYGFSSNLAKQTGEESTAENPVKRKPSYPSSLGSGPLARPTQRMVSNPVLPPRAISNPLPKLDSKDTPMERSPRSVSDPVPRSTLSLSMSSRRREGFSLETSKSLVNLSDALEKLKMKRPETPVDHSETRPVVPRLSVSVANRKTSYEASSSLSTSTRTHQSHRQSMTAVYQETSFASNADAEEPSREKERSIAALMCSTNGGYLKGVVAFVDVHTAEGEDAGPLFSEMLRSCGAKVLTRLTESVTHVIYKSGRPTTLQWYRKQEDPKPHIVGIGWITGSKKNGKRIPEEGYIVDVAEENVFQARRKSMEPKQLALRASVGLSMDLTGSRSSLLTVPESANLTQARSKSLLYAPKIGSPLKKAHSSRESDIDSD